MAWRLDKPDQKAPDTLDWEHWLAATPDAPYSDTIQSKRGTFLFA